jgi:glycosyltransferase involved in cell wall biosynthesis
MAEPRVAVVIPIFKQPSLAIDAIESVLRQECHFAFGIVAVNDSCPFEETDRVCRAYARAHPGKVLYVRKKNGGLGGARNTGIAVALGAWPSVEAVQLLDSDDVLGPQALAKGYRALHEHPEASWVYTDQRRFGFGREYIAVPGPWSALELMAANYLPYACLFRRALFERGFRYDEEKRTGYEDWEMWLQCIAAGLRGWHVPDLDFGYRKRAESMLSDSNCDKQEFVRYLRGRHPDLFRPRRMLELEQQEMPRFAVYLTDAKRLFMTSDPSRLEHELPLAGLGERLVRAAAQPGVDLFPPWLVVTTRAFLGTAGRFAPGLLWRMQVRLEQSEARAAASALRQVRQANVVWQFCPAPALPAEAAVVMLPAAELHECLKENRTDFAPEEVEVLSVRYGQPDAFTPVPADAFRELTVLLTELGPAYRAAPHLSLLRGKYLYRQGPDPCTLVRRMTEAGPTYPRLLDRSLLHVGYVVPLCDFGGAERVTLNLARETRRRGWVPHLFVIGTGSVRLLGEFRDTFESIAVVDRWELWHKDLLLGLLGTMDVVVNNNCAWMNEAAAPLRRTGVKTFTHLHSITLLGQGFPCGQPFEALRYEHSLDGILVISEKLRRWCLGKGMPAEKVVYVPNAPSFGASDALVETTLIERAERTPTQPLRVLFIGRFDAEKGLDRLAGLVRESRRRSLPLEWRVVGRKVLGHGPGAADLRILEPLTRPPALSAAALGRVYRWADVVVMLSRYEGVPLTILEAQRFGCVVLSTRVGAIDELIEHGRTGFLFDNDLDIPTLVDEMLSTLRELHLDRTPLLAVAEASAALRRQASWSRSFATLAGAVEALLPHAAGLRDANAPRPAIRLENRRKGAEAA